MPDNIFIQVGQCGNQIGARFWDMALREHAQYNKAMLYDETMATFFRNMDETVDPPRMHPLTTPPTAIKNLKARAVLVDMESSVIQSVLQHHPLRSLFTDTAAITDQPGSGNNWATGFHQHFPSHHDVIADAIRHEFELSDCVAQMTILHSTGGGTGSGVGSAITRMVAQDYVKECGLANVCVVPRHAASSSDLVATSADVITGPYNSLLTLHHVLPSTDYYIPIENAALSDIAHTVEQAGSETPARSANVPAHQRPKLDRQASTVALQGWDAMNNIVGNMLLDLTSSARFPGSLNFDLSDLTTNLVPFPTMNALTVSMAPLFTCRDVQFASKATDALFLDAFSKKNDVVRRSYRGVYLAAAVVARGNVTWSQVRNGIDKVRAAGVEFVDYNPTGWKIGLCNVPSRQQPFSVTAMQNATSIHEHLRDVRVQAGKLFKRKAHFHHYEEEGVEAEEMRMALEHLKTVEDAYLAQEVNVAKTPAPLSRSSSSSLATALASPETASSFTKKLAWCKRTLESMT